MNKFEFDGIEDFDKHIEQSIPNYVDMLVVVKEFIRCFTGKHGSYLDVGCTTGKLALEMEDEGVDSYGVDSSSQLADGHSDILEKKNYFAYKAGFDFDVISSIFFLQFLSGDQRGKALGKMWSELSDNGYLIVCEKTYAEDSTINNILNELHMKKKLESFSHEDILEKNMMLVRTMRLKTEDELHDELVQYGTPRLFWKSHNFVGYIIKKES